MSNPLARPAAAIASFSPPPINTVDDTGLSALWLQDLALKILYSQGYMSGFKIAELIALPFAGITDLILEALKREKLIEVKSSQGGLGEGAYTYGITGAGVTRAREALERSQYASAPFTNGIVGSDVPTFGTSPQFRYLHFYVWTSRERQNQRSTGVWQSCFDSGNVHPVCVVLRWTGNQSLRSG
jgi:hypothetical protein